MADTSNFYTRFAKHALNGTADLDTATVVAILCTNAYTFDQDAHEFISDITNELAGGGYARETLTGVVFSVDTATNKVKFTCDPMVFSGLTGTFRKVVYAVSTGTDSTSPLIKCTQYDADKVSSGADVTITPHANGLGDVAAA